MSVEFAKQATLYCYIFSYVLVDTYTYGMGFGSLDGVTFSLYDTVQFIWAVNQIVSCRERLETSLNTRVNWQLNRNL